MKPLRLFTLIVAALCAPAAPIHATDAPAPDDAILILDASGSMWGQIDGINKIVIAKDVVETIVRGLPDEQRLGMVAYGHRKKGDCSDIQTLADVGANRDDVIAKIRTLSPKGMTPLTKSVEHAANALNYTQNAATVILVSDGLENCAADPCALARLLEEKGLDFTVHVVGFDVTPEERKGLECIAQETGGEFLAADNASELNTALAQVALPDEPTDTGGTTSPQTVAFKATMLRNGPDIQSKLNWKVTDLGTGQPVFEKTNVGYVDSSLPRGDYRVEAVWNGWPHQGDRYRGDKSGRVDFTVAAAPLVITVPIDLNIPVALEADPAVAEGFPVNVRWSGPDDLGASITVNRLDDGPRDQIYFTAAQRARDTYQKEATKAGRTPGELDTNGDGVFDQDDTAEAQVGGPSVSGDFEVRYVLASPRLILMRVPLNVTDTDYTVAAPADVPAGSTFDVTWSGTLTPGDFVTIERADERRTHTPQGNRPRLDANESVVRLTAPAEPGDYEVRYVLANGYTTYPGMQHAVQARHSIRVMAVNAAASMPSNVVGGSTHDIELTPVPGEGWEDDFVSLVTPGATKPNRDSRVSLSKSTDGGKTVQLQAPNVDGDYELVYFQKPGDRPLARQPVTITRAQATVEAPASVKAGSDFSVSYSGPIYRGDRIVVAPARIEDNEMWRWSANYGFGVKEGQSEGTVRGDRAIAEPGDYVVRYVTGKQHQTLARTTLTVTE